MNTRDDFINPEKNKKKEKFPAGQHKPIMIVGVNKESGEPDVEYFHEIKEAKAGIKVFSKKHNHIKTYGIWASKYLVNIFVLEI